MLLIFKQRRNAKCHAT